MKKIRIGALCLTALYAVPSLAAPVITAVYTTYSATGVPTDLNITGTGLCSNNTCTTKPVVKLAGVTQTVTGGTTTGVGVKLGVIADGDYVLNFAVGNSSVNYNLTIKSGASGTGGGSATVTVGGTTTGAAGTFASVSNTGTSSAAILNFTIPRGDTGAQGVQGPAGVAGSAGPQGAPGPSGPQGPAGVSGPAGPQGVAGPAGATGPTGTTGAQGSKGDAGASFNFRGTWAAGTNYSLRDVVTAGGSSYIALTTSTGANPALDSGANWAMMAAKGTDGPPGPAGASGTIGATGPMGAAGSQGPAGAIGPTGPAGATGSAGPSGPMGPTGPQGLKGDAGPTGLTGPSGTALSYKGEWIAGNIYDKDDIVLFHGTPFRMIATGGMVSDVLPPNDTSRFALYLSGSPTDTDIYDVYCGSADPAQLSSVSQAIAALNLDGREKTIQVHGACFETSAVSIGSSTGRSGNYDNLNIKGDNGASIRFSYAGSYAFNVNYTKNFRLENLTIETTQTGGVSCFGMSSCILTRVNLNINIDAMLSNNSYTGFYAGAASTAWLYSVELANTSTTAQNGTGISMGRDSTVWLYGGSVQNFSTGISLLTNGSHVVLLSGQSKFGYPAPRIMTNAYGIRGISPGGGATIEIFSGALESNGTGVDTGRMNTVVLSSAQINSSSNLAINAGAGSRVVFANTNVLFYGNSPIDFECSPYTEIFGVLPIVNISSTCPTPKW